MRQSQVTPTASPQDAPVEFIVWDWNGTLLDDVSAAVEAINVLRDVRKLPRETVDNYREVFGFPVRQYYQQSGFKLAEEDWDALARAYHDAYLAQPQLPLFADAKSTLQQLAQAGVRHILLSACEQGILDQLLHRHGLETFFSHVYGADNLDGSSKVARGRRLLADVNATAATTLLVGDTLHDHETAQALGCRCILISRGHQARHRLLTSGRPVFTSLQPLTP